VFGNKLPRIIFEHKKSVVEGWRKLLDDDFHNLLSSHNIVRVIESRGMR
jgi:hypothetical protein